MIIALDKFSKQVTFRTTADIMAKTVTKTLRKQISRLPSIPQIIPTDQERQFTSGEWKNL